MFRQCTKLLVSSVLILNVAACGQSINSKMSQGFSDANTIFNSKPKNYTASTEHLKFYLPEGYKVKNSSDETNILLSKGKGTYAVFYNPNDSKVSKRFYQTMQTNLKDHIIKEQSYEKNGRFGFTSVLKEDKENYQVIASQGGVKVTGIASDENINDTITELMTIAQSVKLKNK
ncbi:hypothetical protein ACWV26_14665 [Rummeliibacillus sp. JY-2-4R]